MEWKIQTSCFATGITFDDSLNIFITGTNNSNDMGAFLGYIYSAAPGIIGTASTQKIANDGSVIWTDSVNYSKNIEYANHKIFIANSVTTCLSENDSVLWTSAMGGSISVFNDKLFINDSLFYCFDLFGNMLWNLPIAGISHATNAIGHSAIIYSNGTVSVVDSNGLFIWQKTGLQDLLEVDMDGKDKVHVLGNFDPGIDWWLCPFFTGHVLDGAGNGGDGYVALLSYDTINAGVITTYFYSEVAADFNWSNYVPYFCQGNKIENIANCEQYRYGVSFNHCGQFNTGNQFIELMDDNTAFTSPDTLVNHALLYSTPPGVNYYKVVSTNPVVESNVFTIYVKPNPRPVVTPSGSTTFCLGDSVTLTSTYANSNNVCYDFKWYRNGNYTGKDGNSLIVKNAGTYTGSYDDYSASNIDGCASIPFSLPVIVNVPCRRFHKHYFFDRIGDTTNNEEESSTSLNVYPNPFTNTTTLYSNKTKEDFQLTLVSIDGRTIKKMNCKNCNQFSFGDDIAAGTYYLMIESEKGKSIIPVVKTE